MRYLSLTLPVLLTWGCFSPSYDGPGGFSCKKSNACPEGFVCVSGTCVREGTSVDGAVDQAMGDGPVNDDSTTDGPLADAPWIDGPHPDTLQPDGPASDATVPDAYVPDTKSPDSTAPDAPVPDTKLPDSAAPDATAPDAYVPDMKPDATAPDAPPAPYCNFLVTATDDVTSTPNNIDIALDSIGQPHAFWIDPAGVLRHLWRLPSHAWTNEVVAQGQAGDRLAATIDGADVMHVAFRKPSDSSRPWYTYKAVNGSTWSTPTRIILEDELGDGLDVAAHGANVYISADRDSATNGKGIFLFKVNKAVTPYTVGQVWALEDATKTYVWGRLAAGSSQIATSYFDGANYVLQATPVGGGTTATASVTGSSSGPAPVAVTSSNLIIAAHANFLGDQLRYNTWNGQAATTPSQDAFPGSQVDPFVVDIRDGGAGITVIVYRDTTAATPYLRLVKYSSSTWGTPVLASQNLVDDARLATNPLLNQAWIAFSSANKLSVVCKNY